MDLRELYRKKDPENFTNLFFSPNENDNVALAFLLTEIILQLSAKLDIYGPPKQIEKCMGEN